MPKDAKPLGETAELQRLAAIPAGIAEAIKPRGAEQLSNAALLTFLEGDAQVETMIQRIRELNEQKGK